MGNGNQVWDEGGVVVGVVPRPGNTALKIVPKIPNQSLNIRLLYFLLKFLVVVFFNPEFLLVIKLLIILLKLLIVLNGLLHVLYMGFNWVSVYFVLNKFLYIKLLHLFLWSNFLLVFFFRNLLLIFSHTFSPTTKTINVFLKWVENTLFFINSKRKRSLQLLLNLLQ